MVDFADAQNPLGPMQQMIFTELKAAFDPSYLTVENESHRHNVPPGSESHFKVTIATTAFEGRRLIQRHQAVNRALKEVLALIHALALHTYTPVEWQGRGEAAPQSPNCLGGELKSS